MMRGLAEYVMTGRRQAMIAVMLLGLIPLVNLLNPVVVGLIALRKGLQEAGMFLPGPFCLLEHGRLQVMWFR